MSECCDSCYRCCRDELASHRPKSSFFCFVRFVFFRVFSTSFAFRPFLFLCVGLLSDSLAYQRVSVIGQSRRGKGPVQVALSASVFYVDFHLPLSWYLYFLGRN